MIDLIKLRLQGIDSTEIDRLVEKNRLQTNSRSGVIYYDNEKTKNINDGFYLKISTAKGQGIQVECSLHKFWNFKIMHKQANFDTFTIANCIQAVKMLSQSTGIDIEKMRVTYYEIGLNLPLSRDCLEYMSIMQAIGIGRNKKKFYVNPRYRGRRVIITEFYNQIKKVYKVYDKCFEMRDKRQNNVPDDQNILRIETIRRKVERLTVAEMLSKTYLQKLCDNLAIDWRSVQFERNLITPKGTPLWKADVCRQIMETDTEAVLLNTKKRYNDHDLSEWHYRCIRAFVLTEWPEFKLKIKLIPYPAETEYRKALNKAIKQIKT